jgi:hypothetical protein
MALPFLLLAAQAGQTAYGLSQSRRAERRARGDIGAEQASIDQTIQGLNTSASYVNMGADVDQQMLDLQMQQSRLATTEKALYNNENLRQTLSSQRALFAARGQNIGQGTARTAGTLAEHAHGREETARRLNQSFNELTIKGHKALTEINRGYSLEDIQNQKRSLTHQRQLLGSKSKSLKSTGNRERLGILGGTFANIGSMNKSDFTSKGTKSAKKSNTLFSGYEELFSGLR